MSALRTRVLLVEDDEDDFVLTRQLLHDIDPEGYDLEWSDDFDQALQLLGQGGYDVCLVDYRLGTRNGVEFILAAIERGVGAPIILLTGQGDREVDVAAMHAGAADYLSKAQLSPGLLERSIRYSIQQKKTEQQRIRLLMEQAARAEAVAENRSKDEFLAVLSHELRTPLSAVLLSISALEQEGQLDSQSGELVSVIKRNIDLEARLIDDLLDLTRISRGKIELRREIVDLHGQIDYAVRYCCAADIHDKSLKLQLQLEAGKSHVWADPARLQQVLWNLVKNAVKFTPSGGTIGVRTGNRTNGRMFVEVQDNGIGIAADALPKIFNAFEQADRTITRRFGGLGLGLAICRALVQLHGGTIEAESAGTNQGALFRVELPVTIAPEPSAPPANGQHDGVNGAGVSILLVEDHADTANLMRRLLQRRGFNVQTAGSVAEALRTAKRGRFNLIISDIGLPDGSGLDLMRQLRAQGLANGIALSGFGMEEDIERSRAAGFAEHLTKPINMGQLGEAIERVLNRQNSAAIPAGTQD